MVICNVPEVCPLELGKSTYQRVLRLTLLASAFLPINFVLKRDVLFHI